MAEPPPIPPRISSKRGFNQLQKERPSLISLRDSLRQDIKHAQKKLKPSGGSFDSVFWNHAKSASELQLQKTELDIDLSRHDLLLAGGSEEEWDSSTRNQELSLRSRSLEFKIKTFAKQADRLDFDGRSDQELAHRRAFVSMFTSSPLGLNIAHSSQDRDSLLQSKFRAQMIDEYRLRGTGPRDALLWDVILGEWVPETLMTASHIFAYRHGAESLGSIFGVDVKDELFSPRNGLMLSSVIEKQFESGFFAIVPFLPESPTDNDRQVWRESEPKEYKLRFIDKPEQHWVPGLKPGQENSHRYNKYYNNDTRWRDLDGKKLEFKSNLRPRARFLYFHFVVNMLTFAWRYRCNAVNILESEADKMFWGSPGAWVKQSMLTAFMEEVGHVIDPLLRDTVVRNERQLYAVGDDGLLTQAATSQMVLRTEEEGDAIAPDDELDSDDEDGKDSEELWEQEP